MSVAEAFDKMEYGTAPESAAEAQAWLDHHDCRFNHFIASKWQKPKASRWFDTFNPANGRKLARIAQGGQNDVDSAVRAARRAHKEWAKLDGHIRAKYLYAIARAVQREARLLAVLETMDNGKPIRESRDIDIPLVGRHFYHHAGWAQLLETEFPDHEALGVVGAIIPWNFPLLMLAWKLAPALAAGNTIVLKPAEYTSLTALKFAEICKAIGLPAGVVNIVTGDGRTGECLVNHAGVDKIAFTGSTEVGRRIRQQTAGSGKHLTLELGGKSPFIIFDDADIDSAVEGVVDAIWFNQGQVCCAGSRLLVQETISKKVERKLKARMAKLRVGDPMDKSIDIGAIIAPVQLDRVNELVEIGKKEGCKIWQPKWAKPKNGWFYPPTLFTDVSPAATIAQEEIFGPVLAMMTFRTKDEAISLANNSRYGLAASVWSENTNLGLEVSTKLNCGVVWVNCTNQFDAAAGFGGNRESGFGREGGKEGLLEYLERRILEQPKKKSKTISHTIRNTDRYIDRTPKLYIGGKQARPDSGYSQLIPNADGTPAGDVGKGNRKDVRNAVEAANAAGGWQKASAHNRAQVLYYVAENLSIRAGEFENRLSALTGQSKVASKREVDLAIQRIFTYAAWTDKFDGSVHGAAFAGMVLAINEPQGAIGLLCPDEAPLLAMISLAAPALAMGNTIVLVPSEAYPLIATDFYQILETSDVPGGVFNIVTGNRVELGETLALHDDVDAVWSFGPKDENAAIERASIGNLKRIWAPKTGVTNWSNLQLAESQEFLRQAVNVKNIWIPHGD